jgi:RNA polymerase subunit RPABC4/transcription elongation factor Spt4
MRSARLAPAQGRTPNGSTSKSEWRARCDSCGQSYLLADWLGLAMVTHVASAWLDSHLTAWKAEEIVEVRRCSHCGTSLSRLRRVDTTP